MDTRGDELKRLKLALFLVEHHSGSRHSVGTHSNKSKRLKLALFSRTGAMVHRGGLGRTERLKLALSVCLGRPDRRPMMRCRRCNS